MKKVKEKETFDLEYTVINPQFDEEMRKAKQQSLDIIEVGKLNEV